MTSVVNNVNTDSLDPKDFTFVQLEERIFDSKFDTQPISYFKDAMIRFRRNKASVVAFVILLIIIVMSIIGPMMSPFTENDIDEKRAFLAPRIPVLENFGIFDGKKIIKNVPLERLNSDKQEDLNLYPKGTYTILETYTTKYGSVTREEATIEIDTYARTFGIREIKNLSQQQYDELNKDAIVSESVKQQCVSAGGVEKCYNVYDVVVDYKLMLGFDEIPYFYFGTDQLGRDMWVMVWKGTRISLLIGLIVAIINITIGIIYGSISGYYGGTVDLVMQRIVEILTGIPWIVIMTLVVLYLGNNIISITIALVLTGWVGTSNMVRSQFYRYKRHEYILAARTLGAKDRRIIFRHILPNAVGPIITSSVLVIPSAIFLEATISYLGLGLGSGISIGVLLARGQAVGLTSYPHLTVAPGMIISILMIAFNLFGNGLRDAFNPTLRGAE